MTDRELLTLAAKVAGIPYAPLRFDSGLSITHPQQETYPKWNPLTDDGDALRLAVKLEIDLFTRINVNGKFVVAEHSGIKFCPELVDDGMDPYTATRRAIVRAAAEIGRAL